MRYQKLIFTFQYITTKKGVCTIPRRDPALVIKSLQKCNVVWNVKTYVCAY